VKSNSTSSTVEKPKEKTFTREDLAERWQVCTHTIQNWEREGKLKAIRFNQRVIRYTQAVVEKFEAEGAV
jgi:predicted site-specific integrase-resolvase